MYEPPRTKSISAPQHAYRPPQALQMLQTTTATPDEQQCYANCRRFIMQRLAKVGYSADFLSQESSNIVTKSLKDVLYNACERLKLAKHDTANFSLLDIERLFPLDFQQNCRQRVCFYDENRKYIAQLNIPNLYRFVDPYARYNKYEMQQRLDVSNEDLIRLMRYYEEVYNDE